MRQLANIAGERMKALARTSGAERNMGGNTEMTDAQQAITVHNVALKPVEFNGQRVVTLAMIDRVHQRPEGTARSDSMITKTGWFRVNITSSEIRTKRDKSLV